MTDERAGHLPPRSDLEALVAIVESLRADVREDNAALEARMIGHMTALRDELREDLAEDRRDRTEYVLVHAQDHERQRGLSDTIHAEFRDFIDAHKLAQARQDGVLGVVKWTFELVSKHSLSLIRIALAAGAAAGFATGNIRIGVGS